MPSESSPDVNGRVAIIPGAGRGLGRAMAIGLGAAGAKLVLVAAREKAEIGGAATSTAPRTH